MNSKYQQGYVLLALLLVFFVSGSSLMIGVLNNRQTTASQEQSELLRQMAQAKAALLAYAANSHNLYGDAVGPGYLPCPDADNSGLPDSNLADETDLDGLCPSTNILARLPAYAVDSNGNRFEFNNYYAGIDQQFWYAVSPSYLRTAANTPFSYKTDDSLPTQLNLDGTGNIVALIIAPGEQLGTQNRQSNNLSYVNYLDGTNGTSNTQYISEYAANPEAFNDKVLAITHDEYMRYVGRAVAGRIKKNLDDDYVTNGNDYPLCYWQLSYGYCPYESGGFLLSLTEEEFLDSITGDWITSEGWDDTYDDDYEKGTPFYYAYFRNWYLLENIIYVRNPTTGAPHVYFKGCTNMKFQLNHGNSVEILEGYDTCAAP